MSHDAQHGYGLCTDIAEKVVRYLKVAASLILCGQLFGRCACRGSCLLFDYIFRASR